MITAESSTTMKAFMLHGQGDLRAHDLKLPIVSSGHVLLRVKRAGICGSDIHYYSHGRSGSFVPKQPLVLGHEFAGEVVSVGEGVDRSMLGQRVTVDPSIPCGMCKFCRGGRYNLCRHMRYYRTTFAVHAAFRAGSVAGRRVLVTGGGTIGQLMALVTRAFGATQVVVSDITDYPRWLAITLGADAALDATDLNFKTKAISLSQGGFDLVFEASGSVEALSQAIAAAERGATIVQVGTLPATVMAPLNLIMTKELSLVGSFRFANVFATSLDLAVSRRVNLEPLISAVFSLADTQKAMELAISKDEIVKIQIEP